LPSTARQIRLGLKGSYLFVVKSSLLNELHGHCYNHNEMSKVELKYWVLALSQHLYKEEHDQNYREDLERRRLLKKEEEEKSREKKSKEYHEKEILLDKEWKDFLEVLELPKLLSDEKDNSVRYYITFTKGILEDKKYYINANCCLSEIERQDRGCCYVDKKDQKYEYFYFNDFAETYKYTQQLEDKFKRLNFDDVEKVHIKISLQRITKPNHIFTKDELYSLLRSGDDSLANQLVVNSDGYLELLDYFKIQNDNYLLFYQYPVMLSGDSLGCRQNEVGKDAKLSYIDVVYVELLESWLKHLITGNCVRGECVTSRSENELEKLINQKMIE
jgi:hypothetical protein